MAIVQIADVIVPEVFTPYVQQMTTDKSALVASGAMVVDPLLNNLLLGGGLTFNIPSWKDISTSDADSVSSDAVPGGSDGTALDIGTSKEIAVRLSRNVEFQAANLAASLAGSDPMESIANRVAAWRERRLQAAFVATMTGVFADNAAAPAGTEHTTGDMTNDISGSSFTDGVTNFSAEEFINAKLTMGDSLEKLTLVMVHSVVYGRMLKNNLIDFIPDSEGKPTIAVFMGARVIVDDTMPRSSNVYNTWLFGEGAVRLGQGVPQTGPATEVYRYPKAGNGGGADSLHNRWEWIIHPTGVKFAVGSPASGGPSNASSSGNLAHVDSWVRVYPERKQIPIARLITREA